MLLDQKQTEYRVTVQTGSVRIETDGYELTVDLRGFRFGFRIAGHAVPVQAHPESGLRFAKRGCEEGGGYAVGSGFAGEERGSLLFRALNDKGEEAEVRLTPFERHIRFEVRPLAEGPHMIEARTSPLAPVYGLGDYGSQVNTVATERPPAKGKLDIPARDGAELTGYVREDMVNQGTNMRFVSNFAVFPAHRFAQVLFEEGSKRVAFTGSGNCIGVSNAARADALYYFTGTMPDIYADYKRVREDLGYIDKKPKAYLFRPGWEAYGSLGWNTYQTAVEEAIRGFVDRGYPIAWGVVGSAFWKGDRKGPYEGTTTSFQIWDDTYEHNRKDDLPNPRFPDPERMKRFFERQGIRLLLGIRNHFKAPEGDGGFNHPVYNGPYLEHALDKGFLLKHADGSLVRITNAQFPAGTVYVLDSRNAEAVGWFKSQADRWGVQGFKEDAMIYTKHYADGNWNRLNEALMDGGYAVIVRNSAYSVPGDVVRINDTYYGTGEGYHFDQDRVPINLLNIAASGASNLYPDITGGTPKTDPKLPGYQMYFVRNAFLNAVTPAMSLGRMPWEMENGQFEGWVKKAAKWHDRYSPYIYSAVLDGYRSGYPHAMTPLHIAYPDDPQTYGLINRHTRQYEWMLGPSMLAAPVYGNDFEIATARDVYLPAGRWMDYETGEVFEGPATLRHYPMPLGKIPVFVGGKGTVVFRCPEDGDYYADVYPVAPAGTRYDYTHVDGESVSSIAIESELGNGEGTEPIVREKGSGRQIPYTRQRPTGSVRFRLEPGMHYTVGLRDCIAGASGDT